MARIITFGEIMLRLQPPSYGRLAQADSFQAYFGGSEANTAAALAQWGEHAIFVSKLPDHELGDRCIAALKALGVDTSRILRADGRIGLYYTERGASQRPPLVLYDRKHSVFSLAGPEDFDFPKIFKDADWFHFSGITPALSAGSAHMTKSAVEAARGAGAKISCDLNFRSKLWSASQARQVLTELISDLDVLIANENQARALFEIDCTEIENIAEALYQRFRPALTVLTKRRTLSGEGQEFSAFICDRSEVYASQAHTIGTVEKIGAGDAFDAGLIFGLLNGKTLQETVDFAVAAACLKHTVEGDMLVARVSDVEALLRSDGGRMIR
jgi:2-dehydro-3-deoxygluconokinase